MADYPPFMNAPGAIPKILNKIIEAKTPSRFTQDYLASTLGFPGGNNRPFIPLAKRLGLLSSDGTPTKTFNRFRDPNHRKTAMAQAIRAGFPTLFARNENAHQLDKKGLEGLVIQATGLDQSSVTLRKIVATFEALKAFADFSTVDIPALGRGIQVKPEGAKDEETEDPQTRPKLNLSYNINLNLPKSDDPAVFNAIFKALKDHLLRQ